ncbi:MAG: hypothetical protein HGA19_06055 [Oscillochloris sp.]|nr:hypothetical protein [Oscillochloris sp.]
MSQTEAERVLLVADELSEVRNAEIEGDSAEVGAERLHRTLQTPSFEAEPDRLPLDALTQLGHTLAAELDSLDVLPTGFPHHAPPSANPATSVARLRQLIAALPLRKARFDLPQAVKDEGTVAEPPTTMPSPQSLPTNPASSVAASMPERIPNVAAQPNLVRAELELHDILDALAREIEREYRRFYGT